MSEVSDRMQDVLKKAGGNKPLEAGIELDKSIADALHLLTFNNGHMHWIERFGDEGPQTYTEFTPSTDANHALWAAERATKNGIAVHSPRESEQTPDERWQCILGKPGNERRAAQVQVRAATPELAICLAILELKK